MKKSIARFFNFFQSIINTYRLRFWWLQPSVQLNTHLYLRNIGCVCGVDHADDMACVMWFNFHIIFWRYFDFGFVLCLWEWWYFNRDNINWCAIWGVGSVKGLPDTYWVEYCTAIVKSNNKVKVWSSWEKTLIITLLEIKFEGVSKTD